MNPNLGTLVTDAGIASKLQQRSASLTIASFGFLRCKVQTIPLADAIRSHRSRNAPTEEELSSTFKNRLAWDLSPQSLSKHWVKERV